MRTSLIVLTVLAVTSLSIFLILQKAEPVTPTAPPLPEVAYKPPQYPIATLKQSRTPPEGYKEYRSEFYRFQLLYPSSLLLREYEENGSARTITFRDPENGYQFQIFVTPYGLEQISQDRLKKDIPSGVIIDQQQFTLDGVPAIAFFSTDATLGETREVWFIARGFLYEVTTYKQLDQWLSNILSSWQFL